MNPANRWSLIWRALIALLLTIGFYALALGIAFGLLYLIYLEIFVLGKINVRLTIFAFIAVIIILWAIFPRIDRFEPPGPRLTRRKYPELFTLIEQIAQVTKQAKPREVYLIPDMNAFVTERGGFMGIGSRRVMGIGLPLFHLVTVDELRSILAHEFGHFYGGDTALGPWVYKTRSAIARTVMGVGQASQILQIPFIAYAKLFLRVTNTISRHQEFTADKLSARITGARIAISSLQKLHRYGPAFNSFMQSEYLPVINAGFQAPLIKGFEHFIRSPRVSEAISKGFEEQVKTQNSSPYDTHPSLKERLAALENMPGGTKRKSLPADSLLGEKDNLETQVFETIWANSGKAGSLKEIEWKDIAQKVLYPQWEMSVKTHESILKTYTPATMPKAVPVNQNLFDKIARIGHILPANVEPKQVDMESQVGIVGSVFGAGLALALKRNGWKLKTGLGEELNFVKDKYSLNPFNIYSKLFSKELSQKQWLEMCVEYEIGDFQLGGE